MAETIEKVIILDIKDFQINTNSSIITALGKNGIFSLVAPGINKSESKNRANLQIGSLSEIEYFQARTQNKISKLKRATLIYEIDYSNRFNLIFVSKAVKFLLNFKKPYVVIINKYLEACQYLGYGKNEMLLTYLVAQSLEYFGLKVQTNKCVECGSPSNLCDFEFYKGGFLCGVHMLKQRWTKELKSYYYLFHDLETFLSMANDEVNKKIYYEILAYLQENGIYINFDENFLNK